MPSSDELQRHYPASYLGDTPKTIQSFLSGELQRTRSWRNETDKVALLESFVCSGTILDVGCADAKFLWALDPQKWQRSGVDFAAKTLQQVRRGISGLDLIEGDIFSSSLQPQSFDVITFWHVLEHLPRPGEVISRVRELLRPGGWIFISPPQFQQSAGPAISSTLVRSRCPPSSLPFLTAFPGVVAEESGDPSQPPPVFLPPRQCTRTEAQPHLLGRGEFWKSSALLSPETIALAFPVAGGAQWAIWDPDHDCSPVAGERGENSMIVCPGQLRPMGGGKTYAQTVRFTS